MKTQFYEMLFLVVVLLTSPTLRAVEPLRIELSNAQATAFVQALEKIGDTGTKFPELRKGNALEKKGEMECKYSIKTFEPPTLLLPLCYLTIRKNGVPSVDEILTFESIQKNPVASSDFKIEDRAFFDFVHEKFGLQSPFNTTDQRHVAVDFQVQSDERHEKNRAWLIQKATRSPRFYCNGYIFSISEDLTAATVEHKPVEFEGLFPVAPFKTAPRAVPAEIKGKGTVTFSKGEKNTLHVKMDFDGKEVVLKQRSNTIYFDSHFSFDAADLGKGCRVILHY